MSTKGGAFILGIFLWVMILMTRHLRAWLRWCQFLRDLALGNGAVDEGGVRKAGDFELGGKRASPLTLASASTRSNGLPR